MPDSYMADQLRLFSYVEEPLQTLLPSPWHVALFLVGAQVNGHAIWPLPLPLLFLGLGLVLYYVLAYERTR